MKHRYDHSLLAALLFTTVVPCFVQADEPTSNASEIEVLALADEPNDEPNDFDEFQEAPRFQLIKDRVGLMGGMVRNESKISVDVLFDTGSRTTRIVWIMSLPPGYENDPNLADVDYVRNYGDPTIPWYHISPNGLNGASSYTTDPRGNTSLFATFGIPVYRTKRAGLHGWFDNLASKSPTGGTGPGEWTNPATGLPSKMAGTPPSPVKKLSALQAFKAGYIRKIKPPAPVAPALNGYGYYVPGQQSI